MDEEALVRFFQTLDRRRFVEGSISYLARLDQPLPIGFGQTISQPTLVLEMTRLLSPDPDSRVLEIGTGSGYQTAFLSRFAGDVYTVELVPELARAAEERLAEMGYSNIHYRIGDGSTGWPEAAPFDRIMVTAAAGTMPLALIEQLAPDGCMVVPVGLPGDQILYRVRKLPDGSIREEKIERVAFVELKGKYHWPDQDDIR